MDRYIETAVESIRIDTPATQAEFWPAHRHQRHELLSAVSVGVTVATTAAVHAVPRGASIWIPAELTHAVRAHAGNAMRCTWFDARAVPDALTHVTVLASPPLLDQVLTHLDGITDVGRRARAEAFAMDLLSQGAQAGATLPQPRSEWLRGITSALVADPAQDLTLKEWAARNAVSVRTLTRRFQEETGMTFAQWRTRLRIEVALSSLVAGDSVQATARRTGYESAAAFAVAFRRATGTSPREFARGTRDGAGMPGSVHISKEVDSSTREVSDLGTTDPP